MSEDTGSNRISLQDNSDRMSSQDTNNNSSSSSNEVDENKENVGQPNQKNDGSWYEKPESLGNTAGEKTEQFLQPVGKYVGKGAETALSPVSGVLDSVIGFPTKAGNAAGQAVGVGAGNTGGGPAKQQQAEQEETRRPLGGQEQTADNPLGLNSDS